MRADVIARVLAGGARARAALISERRRIATERDERAATLDVVDALLSDTNALAASHKLRVSPPRSVTLDGRPVASLPFRASPSKLASTVLRQIARLRSTLRAAGIERVGAWGDVTAPAAPPAAGPERGTGVRAETPIATATTAAVAAAPALGKTV